MKNKQSLRTKILKQSFSTNKLYILVLFLIFGGIYWRWFTPGPRVALDFPLVSQFTLESSLDIPRVWFETGGEGLGQYGVFTLWSYPANLISGILANLGLNFEIIERLFFLIPFFLLGSLGIYKIGNYLKFSNGAKFISTLFYLSNTYILLIIDGGQLLISLAYAFFPFSFLMVEKSIESSFKSKVKAALSVTILGFLDIRFIFILFLLSLFRFIFGFFISGRNRYFEWIKKWMLLGTTTLVIFLGLNAYWIIAQIFVPINNEVFSRLTQTSFTSFTNISHSLLLISPHWFKNIFGVISPIRYEFILIPILVFSAPFLKSKDKNVAFWLLISVTGIFLSKGTSEPFGEVYQWLFQNIPGFSLFRDSTKFFFLTSFSYAVLLGVTTDWLINRVKESRFKFIVLSALTTYLLLLSSPAWFGFMTGMLSDQSYQKEYREVEDLLKKDQNFGRVFWIPSSRPLTYSDPNHPIVEALRLVDIRPFSSSVLGTYELFNYLREAKYMGELFDVLGISHIVYPYLDERRDNLHPDNIKYYYTFLDQLSNLPWVSKIDNFSMPVLKVNNHQDRFFMTSNTWIVLGSDDIYNESTKSAGLSLANNALIFAEEFGNLDFYDKLPFSNIVFYKKGTLDLVASFFPLDNLIFPAKKLNLDPDKNGWWKRDGKDIINWRYFLKTKYGIDNKDFDLGGGWAIAEGILELKIEDKRIDKNKVLLARVLESSQSGKVSFFQENNLVGEVNTYSKETNIRWFKIGEIISPKPILIKTEGNINVLNTLALVEKSKLEQFEEMALNYQDRIYNYIDQNTLRNENLAINYEKISLTKYKIKITGLERPSTLVFSESFDRGWRLNGQEPFPVYSILNGFNVAADGEYILKYDPQKYILPGVYISLAALLIILVILRRLK